MDIWLVFGGVEEGYFWRIHKWTQNIVRSLVEFVSSLGFSERRKSVWKVGLFKSSQDFPPCEKRYIVFFSESHRFGLYHLMRGENHSVMRAPPFKKVCFPTKCRVFSLLLYLCRFLRKKPATSHSHLKGILGGKWCVVLFNSRLGDS